MVTIIAPIAST